MTSNAMIYLDKAVGALRNLGVEVNANEPSPVVALIQKVSSINEESALAIARTLQQATLFNQVVRDNVNGMTVSARYEKIANAFDSIRDDAKRLIEQMGDGKLDMRERLVNFVGEFVRGSIQDRFKEIKETYLDVAKDTAEQMRRESAILEAYKDFRVAMKESEILALNMLSEAEKILAVKKSDLNEAVAALDGGASGEDRARLELERDKAIRALQDHDAVYQIVKDLADNLKVSYSTSEVVMARLMQTTQVKERVYSQSVVFFSTNETVLTGLNAAFVSMIGLNESTRTHEAMKEGINKGIDALADVGDKALMDGVRAGYGPNIRVDSVKRLVDAIVKFQENEASLVSEMRQLSAAAANEIGAAVEDGKRRYAALVDRSI